MLKIFGLEISLSEIIDSICNLVKVMREVEWSDLNKFAYVLFVIFLFIAGLIYVTTKKNKTKYRKPLAKPKLTKKSKLHINKKKLRTPKISQKKFDKSLYFPDFYMKG